MWVLKTGCDAYELIHQRVMSSSPKWGWGGAVMVALFLLADPSPHFFSASHGGRPFRWLDKRIHEAMLLLTAYIKLRSSSHRPIAGLALYRCGALRTVLMTNSCYISIIHSNSPFKIAYTPHRLFAREYVSVFQTHGVDKRTRRVSNSPSFMGNETLWPLPFSLSGNAEPGIDQHPLAQTCTHHLHSSARSLDPSFPLTFFSFSPIGSTLFPLTPQLLLPSPNHMIIDPTELMLYCARFPVHMTRSPLAPVHTQNFPTETMSAQSLMAKKY